MATKIQLRRDTAANWTTTNPVLAAGEIGYETDSGKFKIGDGVLTWTALSYTTDPTLVTKVADLITLSGVAANSTDLGTFTGTIIPDASTIKGAFQSLETTLEALTGGMVFKGDWDASVGTFPGAGVAQTGWFYVVSVGGTVDGVVFAVNDKIIAKANNASTTTFSGNWVKVDDTESVSSVNGQTGTVVLDTDDVAEGVTNQYFTEARTLGTDIAGFVSGAGTVSATDTVLTAINKLDGNIALKTDKSTLTTKGDIYAATAANTPARLAVGADDEFLVADSTTATGLKYTNTIDGGTA